MNQQFQQFFNSGSAPNQPPQFPQPGAGERRRPHPGSLALPRSARLDADFNLKAPLHANTALPTPISCLISLPPFCPAGAGAAPRAGPGVDQLVNQLEYSFIDIPDLISPEEEMEEELPPEERQRLRQEKQRREATRRQAALHSALAGQGVVGAAPGFDPTPYQQHLQQLAAAQQQQAQAAAAQQQQQSQQQQQAQQPQQQFGFGQHPFGGGH
jgi:hypothetical protein